MGAKTSTVSLPSRLRPSGPSFADMFTPKLVGALREGYGRARFLGDLYAGVTVAIVALPLSMAIAIASGTTPDRGLYAAIVGGFVVSLLGGSRFQIGGPAGAFIVLVAAAIERHGIDGFLLATLMAGAILIALGLLRLGSYIRYIPQPVTVGFTSAIAIVIFASQIRDILGLTLPGREPGALVAKIPVLWAALPSVNPAALALASGTIATIVLIRRYRPAWPGLLIAVAGAALVASVLAMPVETIGSRFGGVPSGLPAPAVPTLSWARVMEVLPTALTFALLGGIESLLSAVVADTMTGRRHRSNCELVAQGAANMASALFGGLCVTGTIARTATNVRSGATSPVAGIVHAAVLLLFLLVASPLASAIPLAALAGVLAVVAWNMAERHAFVAILKQSPGEAVVLGATFLLTLFRDLTEGIAVGVVLGSLLFMHRMADLVSVQVGAPLVPVDEADRDAAEHERTAGGAADPDMLVCRIAGPLFFGACNQVASALEQIGAFPKTVVLDLSAVPFVDASAARSLRDFAAAVAGHKAALIVAGASESVRLALTREGLRDPALRYVDGIEEARRLGRTDRFAPAGDRAP